MLIEIPVSLGELVDKITILSIKAQCFEGQALVNVQTELNLLEQVLENSGVRLNPDEQNALQAINQELWQIEEELRHCEAEERFGDAFIALARAVYRCNDERAALKRAINLRHGSQLVEEKSYRSL